MKYARSSVPHLTPGWPGTVEGEQTNASTGLVRSMPAQPRLPQSAVEVDVDCVGLLPAS